MKILMINSVCGFGSTGRICTDIADVLLKQEYQVRIAYGRGSVKEKYEDIAIKIGSKTDNLLHGLVTRFLDRHGLASTLATKRLIRKIRSFEPDVIHLHNIHGYYINYKVLFDFLKEYDHPVIWTLHDCWAFTGHCSHFDLIKCDKWMGQCDNCPQKREYPASILLDRSKRNYTDKKRAFGNVRNLTLVTPSKWLGGLVKKSFLSEYDVEVIPNGIDTDVFKYREGTFKQRYGLEGKKIILGVASVWEKSKGLGDLLELSKLITDDYRIVIVGVSKEQIVTFAKNMVGIERTESVDELAEIYSSAECLFNPTRQDTYPTVNIEACACGTPVVTYNTGGSPEGVFFGKVIGQGDLKALIKWLEENKGKRANVSDFIEKIQRRTMVDRYVDLIERVVK